MKKFLDIIQKETKSATNETKDSSVVKGIVAITKSDDEKMLAFGWANVSVSTEGEVVEDLQDDIIEPEELEAAAYRFVEFYREGGEMHEEKGKAVLVESVVFTKEKMEAIGIPEGTLPVGWWIGFKVLDGEYPMFSIEGTAKRIEV